VLPIKGAVGTAMEGPLEISAAVVVRAAVTEPVVQHR
jgi:hypothetical protein